MSDNDSVRTTTDFLFIGSSPPDEDCVQIVSGADNYSAQRLECLAYIKALRKKLGPEPDGALLKLKRQSHDFGDYVEVVCHFNTENEAAVTYALACEGNGPQTWAEVGMRVTLEFDPRDPRQIVNVRVEGAD